MRYYRRCHYCPGRAERDVSCLRKWPARYSHFLGSSTERITLYDTKDLCLKEEYNKMAVDLCALRTDLPYFTCNLIKVKVKVKHSRYRPGVAQRVPGS
jgi:hypothetical protein